MHQTNKLTDQELFFFCEQFSVLLHSGISCSEGLHLMQEDSHTPKDKEFFGLLLNDFEENGSFSLTLKNSGFFPDFMVSYVKIGEETGCLDEVMRTLALHYEQEIEISETLKSTVTYPLLMLVMMGSVIFILLSKVLPVFKQVFEQMGLQMNHFSNGLLNLAAAISRYSVVVLCLFLLLLIVCCLCLFTQKGRTRLKQFSLKVPYIKEVSLSADYARLTQAISMGIHSGLDHIFTLEMAQTLLTHPQLKENTQKACLLLENGMLFEDALTDSGLFEGMNARLLIAGLRAGSADEVMSTLAKRYRENALAVTGNLVSIVEPTIVILFSLLVGLVLLSVMMPLLGILSEIMV